MTRTKIAMGAALFTALAAHATAEEISSDWELSIGIGTVLSPSYLGDDNYQLNVAPNISFTYGDRFFASLADGVGYNIVNFGGWRVGPIIKYDFGRDEDGDSLFAVSGDDTDDLRGLGDVDGTVELGGFVEYRRWDFTGKLELRQGVGGHEGLIGGAEVAYGTSFDIFGREAYLSAGPDIVFGSGNYVGTFFDVNSVQSAASGLAEFDAGGGLVSFGFGGSLVVPVAGSLSFVGFASYDRLAADVADSSLVQERGSENQAVLGVFLNYSF